jgi:hypothetical protein
MFQQLWTAIVYPWLCQGHFAPISYKSEFLLHNLVVLAHAQVILHGQNLVLWLSMQILVTPVSHTKHLNSLQVLICNYAWMSWTFCNKLDLQSATYDSFDTHDCGNSFLWALQLNHRIHFLQEFLLMDDSTTKTAAEMWWTARAMKSDLMTWESRTFNHYHTDHNMFVCMNDSSYQ